MFLAVPLTVGLGVGVSWPYSNHLQYVQTTSRTRLHSLSRDDYHHSAVTVGIAARL